MSYLKPLVVFGILPVLAVASIALADTVYTWRTPDGEIHLGSRRPVDAHLLVDVNKASASSPTRSAGVTKAAKKPFTPVDPELDPILRRVQDDAEEANKKVLSAKALFEKARAAYEDFQERARRNRNFERRKRSVIGTLKDQAELAYEEYTQAVDRANILYRQAAELQKKPVPSPSATR